MTRTFHTAVRLLAGALCIFAIGAAAQTVRPLINELGNPSKGRVEYVNDGLTPLNVVLEARSFTVTETGDINYRPLDPDIHLKLSATSFRIQPVKMDFHYGTSFGKASPEAYERLLLDAMSGDATLFARRDEVEQAWAFIDPIEEAWHAKKNAPELFFYPAGSWGPEAADDLLARDGRAWRRL